MRTIARTLAVAAILGAMLGCAMSEEAYAYDGEIDAPDAVDVQPDERDPLEVEAEARQAISGADFMALGVVYDGGIRFTWYSSNALWHYRTDEWTAGDDGIYRDLEGYVVVASDDDMQGDVVSTPFGEGKVYDSGCGSGTVDVYTNF